ncbi:MAG TPA: acetylornithine deacetylase [Labilithrix sp.]
MTSLASGSRLLEPTVERLRWLVSEDTTNPPRKCAGLVARLAAELAQNGLGVDIADHGDGCVSVLARRGKSNVLLTAHVDTVPIAPDWTRDPLALAIEGDRAYALGACDVKGGAAAMMTAAFATKAPCALLFTTDEEAGQATCMKRFAAEKRPFELAVVAEPTRGKAVLAHRGLASGIIVFAGRAGHASVAASDSAVHAIVRWAGKALDRASELETATSDGLSGVRLNVGRIEGGVKANVVAARAEARFGVRPPPALRPADVLASLAALAEGGSYELRFEGAPLAADARAAAIVDKLRLPCGEAVDFWTEASILAASGVPSIVLGPGDIAQAHGPDEWVALAELESAAQAYLAILEGA